MHPEHVGYDLPSFVGGYLQEAIQELGLSQGSGPGGAVTLYNENCILRITSNGPGVTFSLANATDPSQSYDLGDYLDAMVEGGYFRYFPMQPQGTDGLILHQESFKGFNNVLTSGVLSAPLKGDFAWIAEVVAMEEEDTRLSDELTRLEEIDEHPESEAIWDKKLAGDPTWMDDVKRILAEQESKS